HRRVEHAQVAPHAGRLEVAELKPLHTHSLTRLATAPRGALLVLVAAHEAVVLLLRQQPEDRVVRPRLLALLVRESPLTVLRPRDRGEAHLLRPLERQLASLLGALTEATREGPGALFRKGAQYSHTDLLPHPPARQG